MKHEAACCSKWAQAPARGWPGPPCNTASSQRSSGMQILFPCGERRLEQRVWVSRVAQHMPSACRAQKTGYVSRAAYKLLEIQDKHKIIKPGACVDEC